MESVRPIEVHKICLVCRTRYSFDKKVCTCGRSLYTTGVCRSLMLKGGETNGQDQKAGYETK